MRLTILGIGPIGTPRRNIARLGQPGLKVTYGESTIRHWGFQPVDSRKKEAREESLFIGQPSPENARFER